MWKEAVMACLKVLSRELPGETEEDHVKLQVTPVQAGIRTERLPNRNQSVYR
jgi:hypothetical protein